MSIRVALNHQTRYFYDRLVTLQPHVVRLRPAPHCRTPILGYSLRVEPQPHFLNWQQDPYSNYLGRLVFPEPTREFGVQVDLVAEMTAINPFDFFVEEQAERYPFIYDATLARELAPYLEVAPAGPRLVELAAAWRKTGLRTVDYLVDVNQELQRRIKYLIRMEPGVQTCEETLQLGSGSCRDSAWLMVQLLRHLGLAARFVSGYLIQLTADVPALDGPSGPDKDFTDLHAWVEAYVPGAGWIGLDPTSGLLAGEGHIPLACSADPQSAAPITGAYSWSSGGAPALEKCEEHFSFEMSVVRVRETPRVTKPYSELQWRAIDQMGHEVDEKLNALDVRLTMGGEPTFVSIDDRDAPEWNTEALGPTKKKLASGLLRRLQFRFAPGALLHFGQGKWYPGESLPRWAFGCYWRRDGVPLWTDAALVADLDRNDDYGPIEGLHFITALAERLGVDPELCLPGFEDAWYYLWRERRLPANVDPLKSRLDDEEERRRLARVLEQGLGHIVGYALPLRRRGFGAEALWESGPWFLRREHLFLNPGDSPMGYRLPLDSLPWESAESCQQTIELDPFAPRDPLPPRQPHVRQQRLRVAPLMSGDGARIDPLANGKAGSRGPTSPLPLQIVRTALCVEPREGRLHIFMPPVATLEDYVDLVAAVEETAAELQLPVLIEGYKPPVDGRLNHFQITPDPGVIEVNTQPVHNWRELVDLTTVLYEEARQSRLCTEKFMLDGRHTGTGGGNHVVVGGPTPADSPILRRPDVLRSLIACWHNHPSLSYLFSSQFVGPTSQAPRVDEARHDSLYELEIAFRQIPDAGGCAPWLVDRVFRHLLADVTGNTHRAEFCIDKLYSPDTADGRRGLVELRAFEMPPHAQMSLVQQLLLRALLARFWEQPYRHKLARWGTELHDRFLLPHFVAHDFDDLLDELAQAGYPFDRAWFAPHFEFRFPQLGEAVHRGVRLELRTAIEPWNVLGEEPGAGGAARYVDSSVERVQLLVQGLTDARHVVTCNRHRLPLCPTGTNGEYVAGVRYRAWQPPSCLHPTIGIHTPLVFDVYDTWTGRAIGGCQYHVMHPGGRSFETFPVNASEAAARRQSRFFPFGHSPGYWPVPLHERLAEAPLTLDLRKASFPAESAMAIETPRERASSAAPAGVILERNGSLAIESAAETQFAS
ncbi:MAG: transglutaminase family protein [Planctomycetaceae bacterium]